MSGIVFWKTTDREGIVRFYTERVGMERWLDQPDCSFLCHGNLILGFHQQPSADREGLITFFYPDRASVDRMYERLRDCAKSEPKANEKFSIYHFFASDPEGRSLEFQSFDHPLPAFLTGEELLQTRRSIRIFRDEPVDPAVLSRLLRLARVAPSARNTQPWLFVVIRDRERLARLAAVRGDSSAPIAQAPMAVAIAADPQISPLPIDDACIATYHFLLAAHLHGLGGCWIGAMNRDDVKEILGIDPRFFVATVTPLGWPAEMPAMRPRQEVRVRQVG
ncbi:MAG: nitroreductase family protein [Candidatus Eisenbacteria bacterium]|nr:nitroreductase family protein [Candidatus Eisenbacteria bacterium]